MQEKDVDIFALPPPRTPASGKKSSRPNRNALTTPNHNANVTPKGKGSAGVEATQLKFITCFCLYAIIVFVPKKHFSI